MASGALPVGRFRAVLLAATEAQHQELAAALLGLADLVREEQWERAGRTDLFLLLLHEPYVDGVRTFTSLREAHPGVPVLLLSETLSADFAVELIKHGATDFLSLPPDQQALRRKAERALRVCFQAAFDAPLFAPLLPKDGRAPEPNSPDGRNRRRCFRAPIPTGMSLGVTIPLRGGDIRLVAEEFSVALDGVRGGIRLLGDAALAPRVPGSGSNLAVRFHLPDEAAPVPGHISIIRTGLAGGQVWLGGQYWMDSPRDEDKIQRLWIRCQRQHQNQSQKEKEKK
jgi:CheY-like chemotaxis protein